MIRLNMPGDIVAGNLDRAVSVAKRQLSMVGAAAADNRQLQLPYTLTKQDQFKLGRKDKGQNTYDTADMRQQYVTDTTALNGVLQCPDDLYMYNPSNHNGTSL